ncbi:L-rhamnonate dehydratase [Micromonospora sp. U56]|uniref:L-rhamnonate dehydratase n=1 Tax=Micromonospora sp. U56 TaxID=2824900 RepID=UPI001B37D65A|nr:L-rhamnonate dehydratase [Micromonospora sp. U56]MBQ0895651.1 L-rhamnonate dehydratase [Micromonospora sp. U56]
MRTAAQTGGAARDLPTIRAVRAYTVSGGGADYHDQADGHWIDDHIATPMARYPAYRASRKSFGIDVLGTLVVEIEAADGTTGFAVTVGGDPGAWIIEHHLARFLEGAKVTDLARLWDQMFLATLAYGRKGLVLNAISGVDLALWDLLGKVREEPVCALLGGPVHDELQFYATGPRPDLAQKMGFIGGKLPLHHGPAEGAEGLERNIAMLREMRQQVGEGFWLAYDCWMSLTVDYATRLAHVGAEHGLKWIEEPLLPDDYWGLAELRRRLPPTMMLASGEHEATRYGFQLLLDNGCDIVQPDVGWCGGLTEMLRIAALAETRGRMVVPHGSSVYSYHFVITRPDTPFAEFLMMHPTASEVIPMFSPLLLDEPVPVAGRLPAAALTPRPGFGVRLNPDQPLTRPYPR